MFIVYDKNMNKKEFPKGLRPLDIFIHSIEKRIHSFDVEGVPGRKFTGSTDNGRLIEVSVGLLSEDTKDYRLLRDEAYAFFADDYFYISESYQRGKRYKVSVVEPFIPTRLNQRMASVGFMLQTTELPYAESIGTTQDIQLNGITDYKLWTNGMGLIPDKQSYIYTHEGNAFRIYNAGIPIHPFQQELKITISDVVGSTEFLELRNDQSVFRVNEAVTNQTIVLDGPNITSNGLQYLRKTNKQFITLETGWNDFTITGADSAKVTFDFRFYYK